MASKPVLLVTYKLSPRDLERIQAYSSKIEIRYEPHPAEAEKSLKEAVILFGHLDEEQFHLAKNLRWVHLAVAGVDRMLYPEFVRSDVILTNSKGIHKHQMTELLFGMMLTLTRKLRAFQKLQTCKTWDISPYRETELLAGRTIGILGLGSIGSEIAKVASGFGMRVIGLRRNPTIPAYHVNILIGMENLPLLLKESDHIVVVLPLTAETRNLITKREFDLMERAPYFYNLARGPIVNEQDLIQSIKEGKIKGAGLDVFQDEPLDPLSPLWEMENVIITPHVGGLVPHYMTEAVSLFLDNLQRYLDGIDLLNLVDKDRGY